MSVTQKTIAERLGISPQQVGFALRGTGTVSQRTRELVLRTAEELGYHAHSNGEARALAARRHGRRVQHGTIGYARELGDLFSAWLPYWMHVQNGVQEAAREAGLEVMLLPVDSRRGWEKVDGVLVISDGAPAIKGTLPVQVPFVSLMQSGKNVASVVPDDTSGVCQAVEHLVALGHRRIAYLLYLDNMTGIEKNRLGAYRRAMKTAGIDPQQNWTRNLEDWGEFFERGQRSMTEWLRGGWSDTGCTALLVQNDRAAAGAMQALHEAGIQIPRDVSVVGFDSTDECDLVHPRLTSIHVPLREIGRLSVEMLLRQVNGESTEIETRILPTRLEVRASTAPPVSLGGRPSLAKTPGKENP